MLKKQSVGWHEHIAIFLFAIIKKFSLQSDLVLLTCLN